MGGAKSSPVVTITSADLEANGGQYKLTGRYAVKVDGNDSLSVMGGVPSVAYPVSQAQIASGEFELIQGHAMPVTQVTGRGRESSAMAMPVYHAGPGIWPGSGGGGLDAEYLIYQGAMAVEPSGTWADAASQLFVDLRTALGVASLSDALDFCYILAAETEQAALINMVNPGTHDATNVSSMAFEASRGFTGNGTSSYLNSNYNPATQGVNYLQNSASLGFYIRSNIDNANYVDGGALGGTNRDTRLNSRFSNFVVGNMNTSSNTIFSANASSLSLHVLNRSASSQENVYKEGVSVASSTSSSVGVPGNNFFVGAFNNSGTAALFSARQYALAFAGGSMDATQQAAFFNAVETFMDAIGAGVSAAPAEEPNVVFEPLTTADSLGGVLLAQQGVSPTSNFGAYAGL